MPKVPKVPKVLLGRWRASSWVVGELGAVVVDLAELGHVASDEELEGGLGAARAVVTL